MDLRKRKRTTTPTQLCRKARRVSQEDSPHSRRWADLPPDIHNLILAGTSLAELARLATLSKDMRAAYEERLRERQSVIQERVAEGWPAEVTQGLSQEDMAVPRDLVVDPPIPERLQCSPHLNTTRHCVYVTDDEAQRGEYRGFCLGGKPDGRGEWHGRFGYSYAGDWREGEAHGHGKSTNPWGVSWGERHEGQRHGRNIVYRADGSLIFAGTCEMGELRSGIMCDETGAIWRGHFLDGELHGKGLHRTSEGNTYVGNFQQGRLQGWGVEVRASGDKYVGEWVSGRYYGHGAYTRAATGATRVGHWCKGVKLDSCPSGCSCRNQANQQGSGVSKRSRRGK